MTRALCCGQSCARTAVAAVAAMLALCVLLGATGCGSGDGGDGKAIVVTSLEDVAQPPAGTITLRSAIETAAPGDTIAFASALNGGTILLSLVGAEHSVLKGETYAGMTYQGYAERDYGRSALYARKNLTIDASRLPAGITLKWNGGDANPARVLAVFGDLTLRNVTVKSGHSKAEAIAGGTQPFTLARGGGLAVWGTLTLEHCSVTGNRCTGDTTASRDRGTYGGGIYANGLELTDSTISGNAALGYGAAGGGIYSVGGADNETGIGNHTKLTRCAVTGNRVTAQHAYGGGIFSLSGGPANLASMTLTNCTVARNLVEDNPALPDAGQFYYRGGGVYMGGGSLSVANCTIAENAVNGTAATFSGKPNAGGGGVAATIGSAHTVEHVRVERSIVVGNTLNGAPADWFTGSLLAFTSRGYNLLGVIDFSQILVPVPDWMDLNRRHYPKIGDREGMSLTQALAVAGAHRSSSAISAGTDAGQPAILWYPPADLASDTVPTLRYSVSICDAGYTGFGLTTDDFLNRVVTAVRARYGATLGGDFGTGLGDMAGVTWFGPRMTWTSDSRNAAWIDRWRRLDAEVGTRLGMAGLGDDFWGSLSSGPLGPSVVVTVQWSAQQSTVVSTDQLGGGRPAGRSSDIGAIER